MTPDSSSERRRFARAHLEVHLQIVAPDRDDHIAVEAHDISVGGIRVHSETALPMGETVLVRLTLPVGYLPIDDHQLDLRARVVRISEMETEPGFDLALEFVEIDDAHEESLAKYVRRRRALDGR